jgi:hypothetical protein
VPNGFRERHLERDACTPAGTRAGGLGRGQNSRLPFQDALRFEGHRRAQRRDERTRQMQTPDEASATQSRSLAAELVRRIDAAHAALQSWPSAFATGDVENIRRTLPAVTALSSFLEEHGSEAIAGIGSVVLELWGGVVVTRRRAAASPPATWSRPERTGTAGMPLGPRRASGPPDQPGSVGGTRTLAEPKTERGRRTLHLPGEVLGSVREHRREQLEIRIARGPRWADDDYVFTSGLGRPLGCPAVRNRVSRRPLTGAETRYARHPRSQIDTDVGSTVSATVFVICSRRSSRSTTSANRAWSIGASTALAMTPSRRLLHPSPERLEHRENEKRGPSDREFVRLGYGRQDGLKREDDAYEQADDSDRKRGPADRSADEPIDLVRAIAENRQADRRWQEADAAVEEERRNSHDHAEG